MTQVRDIRSSEQGFTLVELLVAISIGIVVLTAALALVDSGGRANARLVDKTETVQRARIGMDRVVRILRTQTCLDGSTPPLVSGAPDTVTFYSDTTGPDDPATTTVDESTQFRPRKIRLTYSTANGGTVTQDTWISTNTTASATTPTWSYATNPTSTKVLIEKVGLDGSTPFLTYYSWQALTMSLATPLDTDLGASSLPANSVAKVVKIGVSLRAAPASGNTDTRRTTTMASDVYTRNADFSGQTNPGRDWGPRCA